MSTHMDANLHELARKHFRGSSKPSKEEAPSLFDFVPPAPAGDLFTELQRIAVQLAKERRHLEFSLRGVTVGEVVDYYEKTTGKRVGGEKMEDKAKEQRQTSWLPRVMKHPDLVRTGSYRASPVDRHHGNPHRVYQYREVGE